MKKLNDMLWKLHDEHPMLEPFVMMAVAAPVCVAGAMLGMLLTGAGL